jgi:hypothetical protein
LDHVFDASWDGQYRPFAWSPDSRRVIVARYTQAVLVDVRRRTRSLLRMVGPFFNASFSPDGTSAALSGEGASGDVVTVVRLRDRRRQRVARLSYYDPIWGRGGIAVASERGGRGDPPVTYDLELAPPSGGKRRLLLSGSTAVSWNHKGTRILAQTPMADGLHALLVRPTDKSVQSFPTTFTVIDAISRDDRLVLGEASGNVITSGADGTVRVLAYNAVHASWTG